MKFENNNESYKIIIDILKKGRKSLKDLQQNSDKLKNLELKEIKSILINLILLTKKIKMIQ